MIPSQGFNAPLQGPPIDELLQPDESANQLLNRTIDKALRTG